MSSRAGEANEVKGQRSAVSKPALFSLLPSVQVLSLSPRRQEMAEEVAAVSLKLDQIRRTFPQLRAGF
jgi:hypothetical protein